MTEPERRAAGEEDGPEATVRIALVQPRTVLGPGGRQANLETARRHALEASAAGAQLVCFPESFPGEWRMPVRWTPLEELSEIAREAGVYVIGCYADPLDDEGRRCFNSISLLDPDGQEVGRYRRTSPGHAPWIYRGGPHWDFEWVPADQLPVFETSFGTVGLLMCSEMYVPELSRVLAMKGAEIIFLPAGLAGPASDLVETWRTLAWARAIENLAYTAVTSNIIDAHGEGLAMVCAPEEVLFHTGAEGVHIADLDLTRIRWLRNETDRLVLGRKPWRTKPGLLRDWRRPEVWAANPEIGTPSEGDASGHGA